MALVGPPPRRVTDEAIEALIHLQQARVLWLEYGGVTNEQLALISQIQSVEVLVLEGNPITDDGIQHLETMAALRTVNLVNTDVTSAGAERLRSILPRCVVISNEDDDEGSERTGPETNENGEW